jgi:uncharacterized protein YdeI (YjbR/CyaY-like superfamily)
MSTPVFFENAKAFGLWLATHHATSSELLVGYHKVGTSLAGQATRQTSAPSMTWSESVDEALCYGWIDGIRRRIDDHRYCIRFTPRKSSSNWSAVNIAKFSQLQKAGRMHPAGAAAFAHRTETKSVVYAYEQVTTAELSAIELRAFKGNQVAWKFFAATPPSYKKVILHWITSAKRADTRESRFAKLLEACALGKRLR